MPHTSHTNSQTTRANHALGSVTIPPGELVRIDLGLYQEDQPKPTFHVQYQKDSLNTVSFHDAQVPHPQGTYRLYRNFQNFGDRSVTVGVWWRGGGEPTE